MKLTTVELQDVFEGMMEHGISPDLMATVCARLNAEDPEWYTVEQLVNPLVRALCGFAKPTRETPRTGPEWQEYLRKLRNDG